jgi:hypothetical protein
LGDSVEGVAGVLAGVVGVVDVVAVAAAEGVVSAGASVNVAADAASAGFGVVDVSVAAGVDKGVLGAVDALDAGAGVGVVVDVESGVPGSGGRGGTVAAGSAVRATDDDSSFALLGAAAIEAS